MKSAMESLDWIRFNSQISGSAVDRSSTLSAVWAEARFALAKLSESEEHLRPALEQILASSEPNARTQTRKELGRGLTACSKIANDVYMKNQPQMSSSNLAATGCNGWAGSITG